MCCSPGWWAASSSGRRTSTPRSVLPESDPSKMSFGGGEGSKKAWKDIWGSGQGIGAVKEIVHVADLVARLKREYAQARERLAMPSLATA